MSEDLKQYRDLERRLWMTRWRNEGRESAEEDAILDEMENAWMKLSQNEQDLLRHEGPNCWPDDFASSPPLYNLDLEEAPISSAWAYEGFPSPADAILSEDAA